MSSVSPKIGRLTNEIHLESIENALKAGFRAGLALNPEDEVPESLEKFLKETDLWSMDPRDNKEVTEKKPRGRKPKAKTDEDGKVEKPAKKSSGAWVDDPELANKPFDPEFCNCRKWNAGYGAQCNRAVAEDGLCSMHKKQYDKIIDNGGEDLSHGRYNQERPEKCLAKPDKEQIHKWKDLVKKKC